MAIGHQRRHYEQNRQKACKAIAGDLNKF